MIQASTAFTSANAILQKVPIYLIQIDTYTRAFTNRVTGVSGQVDWITSIEDHSLTVNDLDGGADLGAFVFNVQDRNGLITADFPSFVFEGKKITCKTGFPGMLQSDFALLFTGKIDTVSSANGNVEYSFSCVDMKDKLTKVVYGTADDGKPTDNDHRKTVNGHPLDIVNDILVNEIGLTANTDFNANKLIVYRDGIYAGVQFDFSLDSPPTAKDFIEQQIMKPLGGYIWINNKGQIDFNFFRRDNRLPVNASCALGAFTDASGNVLTTPFLVAAFTGTDMTVTVPPGATRLSLGVNDHYYPDNIGGWNFTINSTAVSVPSTTRPWNIAGINPHYQFDTTGSTAPITFVVTPGATLTIHYTGGTVSIGPGWAFVDPLGVSGVGSFGPTPPGSGAFAISLPPPLTAPQVVLDHDNIEDGTIPEAKQADLINTVNFRFDKGIDDGKFHSESVGTYDVSVAKYGQFGQQIIEADGMRSGLQGFFLASFVSQMLFLRYGLKNLQFDEVTAHWTAALVEPGDLVSVTSALVPDRQAGVLGIVAKLFEVLDRRWSFTDCTVTMKLLDASYLLGIGQYLIAPDGTPDFTLASTTPKNRYMFLANASDQYSDTTPGHPLG